MAVGGGTGSNPRGSGIIKEYIQSDFNVKNLLLFFKNLRSIHDR